MPSLAGCQQRSNQGNWTTNHQLPQWNIKKHFMTTCLIDYEAASCRAAGNVIHTNNNIVRPNFSIWRNLAHYAYQLSFGENEIRPYFMTIVDNPGCMSGTPVTLSWEFDEDEVHKLLLDEYKKVEGPSKMGGNYF